jgi:hypothetical protein
MKRQSAVSQTRVQSCPKRHRLALGPAVANRVVSIAFERNFRKVPAHPNVERIVKKEVCQEGTDHPALRRSSLAKRDSAIANADPAQRGATMAVHSMVGFALAATGSFAVGVAVDLGGGPATL